VRRAVAAAGAGAGRGRQAPASTPPKHRPRQERGRRSPAARLTRMEHVDEAMCSSVVTGKARGGRRPPAGQGLTRSRNESAVSPIEAGGEHRARARPIRGPRGPATRRDVGRSLVCGHAGPVRARKGATIPPGRATPGGNTRHRRPGRRRRFFPAQLPTPLRPASRPPTPMRNSPHTHLRVRLVPDEALGALLDDLGLGERLHHGCRFFFRRGPSGEGGVRKAEAGTLLFSFLLPSQRKIWPPSPPPAPPAHAWLPATPAPPAWWPPPPAAA